MIGKTPRRRATDENEDEKLTDLSGRPGSADENPGRGTHTPPEQTEKEKLLVLYKILKDLGINSIGDLEVKISRL